MTWADDVMVAGRGGRVVPDVGLCGEGVLLRHEERVIAEVTPGGIALPDVGDSNPVFEVVAVGPGKKAADGLTLVPMPCKPGDRVIYANEAVQLFFDGRPYAWINSYQVLAVLGAGTSASTRDQALLTR